MKNVLIVDDQSFNQTLLEAYLNQYCKQNGKTMEISTANNGIEAIALCQAIPYDLIFMDILMPVMDGIEATKKISIILPNAIIIIVSVQGDEENQIKALRNGARDYFVKPIQPDVFKRRLHLYLTMIESDRNPPSTKQSINPFTNTIYCYKTTYLIENEEDLTQLWESLLLNIKDNVRTNFLSDLIRFIYQLGLSMLSRQVQPQIIMEENEHSYFFSILNINIIHSHKIIQLIDNYFHDAQYRLVSNLLSFHLAKESAPVLVHSVQTVETLKPKMPEIIYQKETETFQRFDFMEEEDRRALEIKLNELATQFMYMGSNELGPEDVDQIVSTFERVSSILLFYSETQILGIALHDLTSIIQKDEAIFITMAPQMSTLCKSFNNDLILWVKSIFYQGATSIDFMNASIISNIKMVQSFLEPIDETTLEEGDGFEFF